MRMCNAWAQSERGQHEMERPISQEYGISPGTGDQVDVLLDADDIARIFRKSKPRAYALMASGKIPTVRIGRSVRVSKRELERWIQEQSEQSLIA